MPDQFPQNSYQLGFDMGEAAPPRSYEPNRDEVREDLAAILESARAVTAAAPWDVRTFRYNKVVFPQMANWLPDDERNQLCFAFAAELERIERLLAA